MYICMIHVRVCTYGSYVGLYECMHVYSRVEGKVTPVLCSGKHNEMKAHKDGIIILALQVYF